MKDHNIISITSVQERPCLQDFEKLMNATEDKFNTISRESPQMYHKIGPTKLEKETRDRRTTKRRRRILFQLMTDTMTSQQRHYCMSRIRGKNTKPEMIVRRWLWEHGFRYRLHSGTLPGRPDIVMRKHKTVIFINGCFWHGHNATQLEGGELSNSECCRIPQSNRQFWLDKINRNMDRDNANVAKLQAEGWNVITVWECDLRPKHRQLTLENLLCQLNGIIGKPKSYITENNDYSIAAESDAGYDEENQN